MAYDHDLEPGLATAASPAPPRRPPGKRTLSEQLQRRTAAWVSLPYQPSPLVPTLRCTATTSLPCIEVHIANFFKNPDNVSKIAPVCTGMVSGFGKDSYLVALDALIRITAPGKGIA